MERIGELYGSSFDDVLGKLRPALVPLLLDAALMGLTFVVLAIAGSVPRLEGARRTLQDLAFSVPQAMPTIGDTHRPLALLELASGAPLLTAGAVLLATIPLAAYATGGFLAILKDVYLTKRDPGEFPPRDQYDVLWTTFDAGARNHFAPLFVLRLLQVGLAFTAVTLGTAHPAFRNHALGILTLDFLLIFAPYAVVNDELGAFAAIRHSVTTIADFPASSLVTLLFALLTTGGAGVLLAPLLAYVGAAGLLLAIPLYAPVGTALSLFLYKVYLGVRGREPLTSRLETPGEHRIPAEGA